MLFPGFDLAAFNWKFPAWGKSVFGVSGVCALLRQGCWKVLLSAPLTPLLGVLSLAESELGFGKRSNGKS